MQGPFYEQLWLGEDFADEGIAFLHAPDQFGRAVDHRVDFAPQCGLRRVQGLDGLRETQVAD